MQTTIKHIGSLLTLAIFLILAFASEVGIDEGIDDVSCGHPWYWDSFYDCRPITPVTVSHNADLTIIDRISGDPISGIYVKLASNFLYLEKWCENEGCKGLFFFLDQLNSSEEQFTDGSGHVNFTLPVHEYTDEIERTSITVRIEDLNNQYAPRNLEIRLHHNSGNYQQTISLIKNDEL